MPMGIEIRAVVANLWGRFLLKTYNFVGIF